MPKYSIFINNESLFMTTIQFRHAYICNLVFILLSSDIFTKTKNTMLPYIVDLDFIPLQEQIT